MVEKLKNIFLEREKPFTKKRDLKKELIVSSSLVCLACLVIILLMIPDSKSKDENSFTSKENSSESGLSDSGLSGSDLFVLGGHELSGINEKTLKTLSGGGDFRKTPKNLDYLYLGKRDLKSRGSGRDFDRSSDSHSVSSHDGKDSSMIIQRKDMKNALPISFRVLLNLPHELKVDDSSEIPVSALVVDDVFYRENLVIPKGSSFFGYTSFIHSERVQVKWHLVQLPNGIERKIEALCLGMDRRLGIPGKLSGNFSKNLMGSGLSKVIGAYARGSMETTIFGQNRGGHKNGLRNAAAEAATEYGESLSENMRKKIRWITVASDTKFYAIITKPFSLEGEGL